MKTKLSMLVLVAALACDQALAQTPTLTFASSVDAGNGSLTPTLTWATSPAASSCAASGHVSWSGSKAASGTASLPAITLSGTYELTLACTWPGDTRATVTWVPPTQNTDGSAVTKCAATTSTGPCLAKYRVYRRVGTTDMNGAEMTPVDNPNAVSFAFNNLVVGTHNFAVEVVNGNGVPSALSNIASKTITSSQSVTRSVTLTVNPKPGVVTNVEVT